jgi:hypothetical protein
MATRTWWESIETTGSRVAETLKKLVAEGNIRRIRIRQDDRVVAEFPLTVGVVGAVFAPVLAAIGAITALIAECTLEVEREERAPKPEDRAEETART